MWLFSWFSSRFNWATETCLFPTVWPGWVIPACTATVQSVLLNFWYLPDFMHVGSISAALANVPRRRCAAHIRCCLSEEGAKGTREVLASDDITRVTTGQVKPNNAIIQEQALPCTAFSGHLVGWAWMRRCFRRMEPLQRSFLLTYTCSQPQTADHNSRCYLSLPLNFRNTHTPVHTHSSLHLRPDSGLCMSGRLLTSEPPSVSSLHERMHNHQVSRE